MSRSHTSPAVPLLLLLSLAACAGTPAEREARVPRQHELVPTDEVTLCIYDVRDLAEGDEVEQLGQELRAAYGAMTATGPAGSDGMLVVRADAEAHAAIVAHLNDLRRAQHAR